LYSESVGQTALGLLVTQINDGQTFELEQALDRWNTVELQIFLHVLVLHLVPPDTYAPETYASKLARYRSALKNPRGDHSPILLDLRQTILLMSRIARRHKHGCQAVLDVPFFKLLSYIREEDFSRSALAEIYRTFLYISKRYASCILFFNFSFPLVFLVVAENACVRSEPQFLHSRDEVIRHLVGSISMPKPPFVQALALWDSEDLGALVDVILAQPQ
jgi:hypothetical protein